ncbi:MAG: heme d1 biosynthesis radical SAM protein NirJ, partial [Gemmatimonadota bacterium]
TGGEATLRPDLCEIIAYMRDLGFRVSLTTNGFLTGKDPALLDLAPTLAAMLGASLDGCDGRPIEALARLQAAVPRQ